VTLAIGGKEEITSWEVGASAAKFMPSDFNELIKLLNKRRKNNLIYIQLKAKDTGAILHGKEFFSLPPSIVNVLNNEKSEKINKTLTEKIIKEWSIEADYGISGGRKIDLKIDNKTRFN
jgi:hypothetical protein